MSQYEIYDNSGSAVPPELRNDPADPGAADATGGGWMVVVEYSNSGEAKPPTIVNVLDGAYSTREEALAGARDEAFSYNPPDPFSPQGRQVFGDGRDAFLVIIQGAMTTFHMSVRVVQYLGEA